MKRIKYKKRKLALIFFLIFSGFLLHERNVVLQTPPSGTIDSLAKADCGVVLTGSAGRIREAFEILNLRKINKLVISGVYKGTQLHEIFPQLPFYPDVKPENIVLEKISGSTYQNAIQSLQVIQILKCKNILLITSQLHMYRARKTFTAVFPDEIELRTYSTVNPVKEDSELTVLFEAIKSLFYSITPHILQNS